MKVLLLSIIFCAVITTVIAQNAVKPSISITNKQTEVMNPENNIQVNIYSFAPSAIFSRSLKKSDLEQTFNNPGPLTVFLPTDSAFNKLPKGKLDSLLKPEGKYDLIALLTYHALPGKISAKDIAKQIRRGKGSGSFKTISGAWIRTKFDDNGNIILTDETGHNSILQKSDQKQKNGFIHIVSDVLTPKFKQI
jgi:uncharacterized surface protein with fasciclin (FAS1) repeats